MQNITIWRLLAAVGSLAFAFTPDASRASAFEPALRSCQATHGTAPVLPVATDYPGGLSRRGGGLTPASAPGATTVNPRTAHCLMQKLGDELVVIQPMEDEEGIPDALAWSVLAAGVEPNPAQKTGLDLLIGGMTGRRLDRPILVYCHHIQCFLSYNAIIHLKNAGYTNLLWMREGIQGWKKAGLPVGLVRVKGERPVTAATHAKLDELARIPFPKWSCSLPAFTPGNAPADAERRMDAYRTCADQYVAEMGRVSARVEALTESKDFQRMNSDLRDKALQALEDRSKADYALFRKSESRYTEMTNGYKAWYPNGPGVSDPVLQKALGGLDAHFAYDCPRITLPSSLGSSSRSAIESRVESWEACLQQASGRWLDGGLERKTGVWRQMSAQQREIFSEHQERKFQEAWGLAAAEKRRVTKSLVALGMREPEPPGASEEEEQRSMELFIEAMEGVHRQKKR